MAPFGIPEIVAAVADAESVLDAGCGSARLTLALAEAGVAEVVGVDTSSERLEQGQARIDAHPAGAGVTLISADFNEPLPFADDYFGATVSRLALMIAPDPPATLRELRRITKDGGCIATALWAPVDDNPWFVLPRTAAATVVGQDRADYARVFGRIGSPEEAVEIHRAAGFTNVQSETLRTTLDVPDAKGLWDWMIRENGHVRRLDATLQVQEREAVIGELQRLTADYDTPECSLSLPRTITLVTATA
jgi:ubiquinone/menaquinone biosynthesis C-methylase UbiE